MLEDLRAVNDKVMTYFDRNEVFAYVRAFDLRIAIAQTALAARVGISNQYGGA